MMRRKITIIFMSLVIFMGFALSAFSAVEWSKQKTLDLGETPADVATTADGQRTFVLTESGKVLIFAESGKLTDELTLKEKADSIEVSPRGDILYVTSKARKAVDIIRLEFIQKFDLSGTPVKGLPGAPVTVAVFSDFQ